MESETGATDDWRAYFALYGPRLVLFARQWLPDVADAEDAVQDGFVRFWKTQRRPDDRHAGLLFAAVRHAAFDHIRRETRRKHRELTASDDGFHDAGPESSTSWFENPEREENHRVQAALELLPAEQREVLVLKVWGELTFAQIGETLQLSPNTVASRYRYGVNALKKSIKFVCHE